MRRPSTHRVARKVDAILLIAILWSSAAVGADFAGTDTSMFQFNSFGTAGVVHSSENQADFVSNPAQPKGAGYTDSWSATPDTKLGIQLKVAPTDQLSAVVQLMSQYQYDGTFRPGLEWANLKYQVTPDFSIRAGRIAIPTFMVSDSLNIGYALPFARIPLEVYAQLPETHSDGVDGSYRMYVGGATNTVRGTSMPGVASIRSRRISAMPKPAWSTPACWVFLPTLIRRRRAASATPGR